MKTIAVALVAPAAISVFGTKAVGQALTLPRSLRGRSSTHLISRLLVLAAIAACITLLPFFCSSALAQSQPVDHSPMSSIFPTRPSHRQPQGRSPKNKYTALSVAGLSIKPEPASLGPT